MTENHLTHSDDCIYKGNCLWVCSYEHQLRKRVAELIEINIKLSAELMALKHKESKTVHA